MRGRTRLALIALAVVGCDRMISSQFTVAVPTGGRDVNRYIQLRALAQETLASCGAQRQHVSGEAGVLTWRDPDNLPGLTVDVAANSLRVSQHLFGPVTATRSYECVKDTLARRLRDAFGSDRVHVE